MHYFTLLAIFLFCMPCYAQPVSETGLPLPRFVSLKGNKAFMRNGPGQRYPVKWVYKRKSLPIKIINEYEYWRQVEDYEGVKGWMHKSVLSGKRTAIITHDNTMLLDKPNDNADVIAKLMKNVIVKLDSCRPDWCEVDIKGSSKAGWIPSSLLWGVKPD